MNKGKDLELMKNFVLKVNQPYLMGLLLGAGIGPVNYPELIQGMLAELTLGLETEIEEILEVSEQVEPGQHYRDVFVVLRNGMPYPLANRLALRFFELRFLELPDELDAEDQADE